MSTATAIIKRVPLFGRMFNVDTSTGLEELNAWPALMVLASFVWLAIAILLGISMPLSQIFELDSAIFYTAITAHGAAMAFPFTFQLMAAVGMHRAGGCLGKPITGIFASLFFWFMNIGGILFAIAVLSGLKISYAVMYPLPVVGVATGQWSNWMLVLGFSGIALILVSVIVLYPLQIISMLFFGEKREDLVLSPRSLKDPGMLGMAMAAFVLLIMGLPLLIVASAVLLALYGILPMAWVTWATEPMTFQWVFFIFAHNLMEAMAIMVISAVYATLPLYLADGTRKLYSDRIANLALWILLVTSVTSFFHHFFTMYPALPAALSYHGNIMSWATGTGAALTIFTICATVWKHGLRPGAGLMAILMGFVLYILDGVSAIITSNVAFSFQLHGTMWQSGHTMAVLISMSLMWIGVLLHHYPVMTGRQLDEKLGMLFVKLYTIGALGVSWSFLAAGAAGMPRRFAAWNQEGWMMYGYLILLFGLCLAASLIVLALNFKRSRSIEETGGAAVPAE
ncbi:MAG: cbb3-type cytochrome c oxidase subunit I [Hyphomicrobiales bacterium]|nr:cbb3-type cytochrome c oxidase subunit I [Hyphomicrobiales bacterium]